nr:hypothetical protein [Tanacetum cinerariifolium]
VAGGAKLTGERAPHLRRDAGRHARIVRNEHALHDVAIVQPEGRLDGAVVAELLVLHRDAVYHEMPGQQLAGAQRDALSSSGEVLRISRLAGASSSSSNIVQRYKQPRCWVPTQSKAKCCFATCGTRLD